MSALLRYAVLKCSRDGSLWAFLCAPMLIPASALVGSSLSHGLHAFHYPFFMEPAWNPTRNADLAASIATAVCALFAALPAFWTLRGEIASRSIGSLAMAVRPSVIAATLVVFATGIAVSAWFLSILLIGLMTAGFPAQLPLLALKVILASLTASGFGAIAVAISPEPAMIIAVYVSSIAVVPWFEKAKFTPVLLAPLAATVFCAAISGYILERRCAR